MSHVLELFTHPGCISRSMGKKTIDSVLRDFPEISYRELDMIVEQKRTKQLGISVSPTLVFDEKIIAVGIPESKTLRQLLEEKMHG